MDLNLSEMGFESSTVSSQLITFDMKKKISAKCLLLLIVKFKGSSASPSL